MSLCLFLSWSWGRSVAERWDTLSVGTTWTTVNILAPLVMNENELPDNAHVVRYAKPTSIHEDGRVDGSAFLLRPGDNGLSVNWLECFVHLTKEQQLDEVRRLSRLTMRKRGCLAELSVGATKQYYRELSALRFLHEPLAAANGYEADPSHSEITGLPQGASPQAALIGDLIAECIQAIHPAIIDG